MYKPKAIIFASLLLVVSMDIVAATSKPKNRNNEIDSSYSAESGWIMYYDDNKSDGPVSINDQIAPSAVHGVATKNGRREVSDSAILMEILKVSREQLVTQKEILSILKEEFRPEPKIVTKSDGTQCIENSSADCFVVPLTAEARRIPVMARWQREHSVEAAYEYNRWQAKLEENVIDAAQALTLSLSKYGTEAYPLGFQRSTFDDAQGHYEQLRSKHLEKSLRRLGSSGTVSFKIYLGDSLDMNLYSIVNIGKIIEKLPECKFELIFKNASLQKIYSEAAKSFIAYKNAITNKNIITRVDPSRFGKDKEIKDDAATYVAVFQKNGTKREEPFLVGRVGVDDFMEKAIGFFEFEKVISRTANTDTETWKDTGNVSSEYMEHYYGLKLDKQRIREIINGNK